MSNRNCRRSCRCRSFPKVTITRWRTARVIIGLFLPKQSQQSSFSVIGYADAGRRRSPMTCRLLYCRMSKVVCKTCACQTLRLFSSRYNADRKRQHCCCCHLLNKVENIERALDISCTYNALEDTSKIAPSTTWFLGPTRVLTQMAPRSVSKRCVFC